MGYEETEMRLKDVEVEKRLSQTEENERVVGGGRSGYDSSGWDVSPSFWNIFETFNIGVRGMIILEA